MAVILNDILFNDGVEATVIAVSDKLAIIKYSRNNEEIEEVINQNNYESFRDPNKIWTLLTLENRIDNLKIILDELKINNDPINFIEDFYELFQIAEEKIKLLWDSKID